VRELERLLGKKTLENEILKEGIEIAREKKLLSRSPWPKRDDSR
jgi:transposase